MHRLPLLLLALGLVGSLGFAAPAHAQMTGNFLAYGDRGAPGTSSNTYFVNWPVSRAECLANDPIEVQINGAPYTGTSSLVYDLWTGGTGPAPADCQTATNRRSTTGTPPCTRTSFSGPMVSGVQQVVELPPQALFGSACTDSGDRSFFLMAVSAANDTTTDLTTANYVVLRVVFDSQAPSAPVVANAAGDSAVALTWTLPSDSGTLSSARVFVDASATSCSNTDGGVPTSTLVAGATPPASAFTTVTGGSPTTATIDASSLGLTYGQSFAVAVSIIDLARNESVLSNVACVTYVQVEGFWDAYCREQGLDAAACRARYDGCSVGAPGGGRTSLVRSSFVVSLMAVAFFAARLRTRRAARRAQKRNS